MSHVNELLSLEGKVIIMTGGTQRYGYHFCEGLSEAGGTVILTSRSKERANQKAAEIGKNGGKLYGYSLDLADDASIETLVSDVIQRFKKIDVLINNARHIPEKGPADIDRAELDKTFTINSSGMILLTRRVIHEMIKTGGGNIINLGSIYGMGGQDPRIYSNGVASTGWDYAIQKGGAVGFSKQIATCYAEHNIRSNCLSLGGLGPPSEDPLFKKGYPDRTPMGRMAVGEDVKGPIVFLASDASRYMTGANLVIDGGWTAW